VLIDHRRAGAVVAHPRLQVGQAAKQTTDVSGHHTW